MRRYVLAFAILCFPLNAIAQVEFPSTDAFLKKTLTGKSHLSTEARGDLNGDGLEDWAGVIRREKGDFLATYQLYVLLRLREGGYHVAEKSTEAEIPGRDAAGLKT